jgi:hypothetical protein
MSPDEHRARCRTVPEGPQRSRSLDPVPVRPRGYCVNEAATLSLLDRFMWVQSFYESDLSVLLPFMATSFHRCGVAEAQYLNPFWLLKWESVSRIRSLPHHLKLPRHQ